MRHWVHPVAATLFVVAIWLAVILIAQPPSFILPSPQRVAESWWTNRGLIFQHSGVTMLEVVIGLALGIVLGGLTAILLAASKTAQLLLRPILVFSQAIPVFALAPLLTLWLGFGLGSKIAMALLIIYFPITSAFFDGLLRTPDGYLDLARTMQASRSAIMLRIRVPAALPAFASGLRLAAVYAPIGAVIGEWVGASQGLGYLMLLANGRAKTDLMFAAMLTLGVLSVLLYLAADILAKRLAPDQRGFI